MPNEAPTGRKRVFGVPTGAQLSPVVIVCHQVAANKKRTITNAKRTCKDQKMKRGTKASKGCAGPAKIVARFGTLQQLNEWNEELVCCGCCQCSFIVTFLLGGRLKAATTLLLSDYIFGEGRNVWWWKPFHSGRWVRWQWMAELHGEGGKMASSVSNQCESGRGI